jgi:hypothetical protein
MESKIGKWHDARIDAHLLARQARGQTGNLIESTMDSNPHLSRLGFASFLGSFKSIEEQTHDAPDRVTGDPIAKRAFCKLISAGVEAQILNDGLRAVYAGTRAADQSRKKTRHWANLAGMSLPTLKRFPKKLRIVAEQIRKLNKHQYFLPEPGVDHRFKLASESMRKSIAREFSLLPDILCWYALYIEKQPADIGRFLRSSAGRPNTHQVAAILCILLLNKAVIKRPCYREVADMLNALIPKNRGDETWTESYLEKLYRDHVTRPLKASRRK